MTNVFRVRGPMSEEITHGDLKLLLGELKGDIKALHGRLEKVEVGVNSLKKLANMGKGAGWMLFRIGGTLAVLSAAGAFLWDRMTGGGS